ncbi:MAG: DsbA family protein [Bacteroidota bacterium]|nr:DsbA family protein [Bacteroidota bacterium]MDP4244364.1 DsbA family protein [Bacteroidota bacterium]MDP4255697.1 DsbA family protein [Bacteroidota bacterium]MDP4258926.1 DsbA family protein [Bacteroidota bacterium]
MSPTIYYCYDAWCGWCYGFSPVINRLFDEFRRRLAFEVLSGGMILPDVPRPIGVMAPFIQKNYKAVEERTGIRFGEDWLWHIMNPDESDWFPGSEKPAIALCVFKDYRHELAIPFAADLQRALHADGRDLGDDEAYRHLLDKYAIPHPEFYEKLHSEEYREKAYYEFALVKQLQVTGFPTVLLQVSDSRFYLLTRGFTEYENLRERIVLALREWDAPPAG